MSKEFVDSVQERIKMQREPAVEELFKSLLTYAKDYDSSSIEQVTLQGEKLLRQLDIFEFVDLKLKNEEKAAFLDQRGFENQ